MDYRIKFALIALVTAAVIGGAVGLYLELKPSDSNMCHKLNSKYKLEGDNQYLYLGPKEGNTDIPLCCPKSCGEGDCGYLAAPKEGDKCNWKQDKDEYGNVKLTFPKYDCENILNSDDKELTSNVCYIKN